MLDSRTASHVLELIASYLELKGENSFKCRAYASAAQGVRGLNTDDLDSLYSSGELAAVRGLGPATLAVIRDLIDTGESRYLEQLRETLPAGLVEMLEVPGLTPPRIRAIHETLGVDTMEALEAAAKDGRLASVPKIGPKTSAKILKGIATARERGTLRLFHHAANEARELLNAVRSHPDVTHAELAGALRRRAEIVDRIDIVAMCRSNPVAVAQSFGRLPGVQEAEGSGASITIRFVDGARLNLHCVDADSFGAALWRATGNDQHVAQVVARLVARRVSLEGTAFVEANGNRIPAREEIGVYRAAGLPFIEPELREGLGEVDAAAEGALPQLVTSADIRGVMHCHTHYSDGKASVAEMASAARARGWSYIGITDHSQAAAFAGGMSRDKILAQHEEIDTLNAADPDFRILKGVEADILADGQLDYGDELLDSFDFVIGSVHSRFAMDGTEMTERILRAMSDPRLTILGHPTGRKLLARDPYGLDVNAMLEKAAALGIAVELNADPRRLDLDWRHLRGAQALGVVVQIGPDAHSPNALDNLEVGVGLARKAWLTSADILNTRSADDIIAFARARRDRH